MDDPFEPCPDGLMVNREECQEQIEAFLAQLPIIFSKTAETCSCAGSAISIGQTLMAKNGGRVSVFSTARVNSGNFVDFVLIFKNFIKVFFKICKILLKKFKILF